MKRLKLNQSQIEHRSRDVDKLKQEKLNVKILASMLFRNLFLHNHSFYFCVYLFWPNIEIILRGNQESEV